MTGRIRGISTHRRLPLDARWFLCATSPGAAETPLQLDAAAPEWLTIAGPDTVAAALRAIGRWSLDTAPLRLDAQDWWFRATFAAPPTADRRDLVFAGLAGECRVWLNGAPLLATDTMHVARECPAPPLDAGENELLLHFPSLDARLARKRPRPRWRAPMIEHQQLRWARVSLLGRTPGWSPPAPPIGVWRAIEWNERDRIDVFELRLLSSVNRDTGRVTMSAVVAPVAAGDRIDRVVLHVSRNGVSHEADALPTAGALSHYIATLAVSDVVRWWPHTHGEPALYEAELRIHLASTADPIAVDLGRIGFRSLSVDTANGDFAVHVNDVAIFCRGASWTPLDIVSPASPAAATHAALAQVQAAGINMLRVNGCTVYEGASFFEACDALGLLVWQDFMFANMDYPADDPTFLADVEAEARQQLGCWQAHPSLAVICGNSEGEQQAAMWGAPREAWSQALFDDFLAALACEYCPDAFYWPSSARGGAFPHQNDAGTTSYYGVGAYLRPLEDARRADVRFASECLAFANIPDRTTLARMPGGETLRTSHPAWKTRVPRDLGAGWDFEDVRDHYLRLLYGVDPVALRSTDHLRYLELSRAVSAEVIEATVSEWRRPASGCRGALLWFLRDLWAGPGWGLLDDMGMPKAAFHGFKRAATPVHLFLTDEGTNGVALHVVNDPAAPLAATVDVALFRDDGLRLHASSRAIAVAGHGGETRPVAAWFDGFVDLSRAYRFGPADHALLTATLRGDAGRVIDRAFYFPEGLPATRRYDVGLGLSDVERLHGEAIALSVSTRTFAQSVHFDAEGYMPDDDHFHLAPGESRRIKLIPSPHCAGRATRVGVHALNACSGATIGIAA